MFFKYTIIIFIVALMAPYVLCNNSVLKIDIVALQLVLKHRGAKALVSVRQNRTRSRSLSNKVGLICGVMVTPPKHIFSATTDYMQIVCG